MTGYESRTYSGQMFDFLKINKSVIDPHDIARSLAMTCRYNGFVNFHYSTAQHSVYLAWTVPWMEFKAGRITTVDEYRELASVALLHDAAETYGQDQLSGHKKDIYFKVEDKFLPYSYFESQWEEAIFDKYGLNGELMQVVKQYDKRITTNEKRALWPGYFSSDTTSEPIPELNVQRWNPEMAYSLFITTFNQLEIDINGPV